MQLTWILNVYSISLLFKCVILSEALKLIVNGRTDIERERNTVDWMKNGLDGRAGWLIPRKMNTSYFFCFVVLAFFLGGSLSSFPPPTKDYSLFRIAANWGLDHEPFSESSFILGQSLSIE